MHGGKWTTSGGTGEKEWTVDCVWAERSGSYKTKLLSDDIQLERVSSFLSPSDRRVFRDINTCSEQRAITGIIT